MLEQGENIEIEVATPISEEQGEEQSILWEQLALLTSNPELRKAWDDTLSITMTDTGKNGMLYVNESGDNVNNNTLRVALHNREFQKAITDEVTSIELANGTLTQYADIEVDEQAKALYAGINGYFNLLPDNLPNYANPDSTLNRAEFMAMVMRAETPVSDDLTINQDFATAVGQNELNLYAQALATDSYLDLQSKSLNNLSYNGTITRAEAVYILMNHYYKDELVSVDTKGAELNDVTDAGNIAEQQKFIENGVEKDYWKSYELTYAIQNADQGAPTALYKALVLAESKGIIDADTRWDEGLTKAEAVEFLVTVYMDEGETFNSKQGKTSVTAADATETEKAPAGSTSNTGVDSVGSNVTIEEGEYNEVKNQELQKQEEQQAATDQKDTGTSDQETSAKANKANSKGAALLAENNINVSKYSSDTQEFLNEIIGMYDSGAFSEEDLMYMAKDAINTELKPSSNRIELSPESMAELRATSTDGTGDPRTDIQFGQGDYSGLEIYSIKN